MTLEPAAPLTGQAVSAQPVRLHRVAAGDPAAVQAAVAITNAARGVDDPDEHPQLAAVEAGWLQFGWDLELKERYLCFPAGGDQPVAVLDLEMPMRDNLHLCWSELIVHPEHRRQGYGSAVLAEVVERARTASRTTIWLAAPEEDATARSFLEHRGFRIASHDARRNQDLTQVDWAALAALGSTAASAAADYRIERLQPPSDDELRAELVAAAAAINDAPMGELTFEDEVVDVARIRDAETALVSRGDRGYRVIARHRTTGEIGGHTFAFLSPHDPTHGHQGDTAVHRDHRGHRLGLLMKLEMMYWLADAEPQLRDLTTWNNTDNDHMIKVNEALGYRLSRIFTMYERTV